MPINRREFLRNGTAFASAALASARHAPAVLLPSSQEHRDLRAAVVYTPDALSNRERKAVRMLVEEVEKRTGIRWRVASAPPGTAPAVISLEAGRLSPNRPLPLKPEGYALKCSSGPGQFTATVAAADERGFLFGVGGLLRQLTMTRGHITIPEHLDVVTAPHYRLRGHQLGYRNLNNTCDGWSPDQFEQYIRDLIVFGANAIEFIPPYPAEDEWNSANFTLPPEEMLSVTSGICDAYGLDVWFWWPALAGNYADPNNVAADLTTWGKIFARVPRLDAVFVPGGDPGNTPPQLLLPLLEKQTTNLHRWHPKAQMWVSPQGFDATWMRAFLDWLHNRRPSWLTGVVYGPGVHIGIHELRQQLPEQYAIRFYPDITHSLNCQYPVPDWDVAYALTEGREVINPRPKAYANIFSRQMPETIGFITYSEGVNDDFNKTLFSALGWNPSVDPVEVARDYARYFIGPDFAAEIAEAQFQLEKNWIGPLAANADVEQTCKKMQSIEQRATALDLQNWRLLMVLYRAYLDAYVRRRLLRETEQEHQARTRLQQAVGTHDAASMARALDEEISILAQPDTESPDLRARLLKLAAALFDTIRLQLSTEKYHAKNIARGATLDSMDAPLSDAPWLLRQLRRIRAQTSGREQREQLRQLLDRTDPGPGGYYDNLGAPGEQSHLVKGPGADKDPEFRASALSAFAFPELNAEETPMAWKCWAASVYDAPLQMRYDNLDPLASYRVRIVYAGNPKVRIALSAGNITLHPFIERPSPPRPVEFKIPPHAIEDGELTLTWKAEDGPGGNSRGCQVAEVWLVKNLGTNQATEGVSGE